jgi:hypothetical protein
VDVPGELVFIVEGFHVPLIPFEDVGGNAGAIEFWHSVAIAVNAGVTGAVIVTSNVVVVAHCPGSGVNV